LKNYTVQDFVTANAVFTTDRASARALRALYNICRHATNQRSSMRAEVAAHAEEIEQSLELLRRHL
jgi:hypothetical protein